MTQSFNTLCYADRMMEEQETAKQSMERYVSVNTATFHFRQLISQPFPALFVAKLLLFDICAYGTLQVAATHIAALVRMQAVPHQASDMAARL